MRSLAPQHESKVSTSPALMPANQDSAHCPFSIPEVAGAESQGLDVAALVRFFVLLDKWDQETQANAENM